MSLREYSKFGIKNVQSFTRKRKMGGLACEYSSAPKYSKGFLSKILKAKDASSPYKSGMFINAKILMLSAKMARRIKVVQYILSDTLFRIIADCSIKTHANRTLPQLLYKVLLQQLLFHIFYSKLCVFIFTEA